MKKMDSVHNDNRYVAGDLENEASFIMNDKRNENEKKIKRENTTTYNTLSEGSTLFKDPKLMRRKITNDYEGPRSDRESWWRCTIRETPSPLKYKMSSFLNEILRKPNTYRFKSDGRKLDPVPQQGKGVYLLPGAYSFEDFAQRTKKLNRSYSFRDEPLEKAKSRLQPASNPNLGPFSYETESYLTVSQPDGERLSHSFFKSQQKRNIFLPKEGPSPGEYTGSVLDREKQIEVSSCFKSESTRFTDSAKKFFTPGPGQYEPISSWINSKQSQEFNQKGVFFTTSSKVVS